MCERLRWFMVIHVSENDFVFSFYYLNAGWLDCPSFGQEICCMIPSKVPLGESFNDYIAPGRRYSFKQVIHQQRVLGRKVSRIYPKNVNFH